MPKNTSQNIDVSNFIPSFFLIAYLCIGFTPNLEAVDKIAPQWLLMGFLNLLSVFYIVYSRNSFGQRITQTLSTYLSITYIGFIVWAGFSYFYAINPTEVIVNISRQVNVLMMFLAMCFFVYSLKSKRTFLSFVITAILSIEIYAVLNEALQMVNASGVISAGTLKGVTANRNITAFSIAIKIPFVLFLIYKNQKTLYKLILSGIILLSILCLSMIQSRASFLAVGLILVLFLGLCIVLFITDKNKKHLFQFGYLLIPFLAAIALNQVLLSDKGADALARASTISAGTNDGSVNQRLRYYEDVVTHLSLNPIFGVGLGNWKLKSIDYDSRDIKGYVVPYHAHSDFIQLGAELGIVGFLLYLGVFVWAVFFVYRLIRHSTLSVEEKVFLFLLLTALGVYSVDANLNFPIARPQVLVVWTLIMALINYYYIKIQHAKNPIETKQALNYTFLTIAVLALLPSIYVSNKVYESLKGQMFLLQDFNSNQFNVPLNQIDNLVPDIPNITVTTIPINSIKARYYFNANKYDEALSLLDEGTSANPYLYYSEVLKSQIFQSRGQLDSASVYARKAFFGLPNNALHASHYINIINQTRDREALEEAFEGLVAKNDYNNWKNYLIVASQLNPPKEQKLVERAKRAAQLFPLDQSIQGLYRSITVGPEALNKGTAFSNAGLALFNQADYINAAINFEKAIAQNPLEYSYYENAATANYLTGNLDKAVDQIDIVIKDMNPLDGKCEYIKALIYIKLGDPIGACPLLQTSVDSGYQQALGTFNQYCNQ
ncbi:O-antigen ligase family protein [Flavobacteriaceae bacterium]|nr:O-antigen ligase family protein [Flavobacteriaceae bacterium]MDC1543865.1 O-antigen ligase family protein [Flavobacteriaceae bacterium]